MSFKKPKIKDQQATNLLALTGFLQIPQIIVFEFPPLLHCTLNYRIRILRLLNFPVPYYPALTFSCAVVKRIPRSLKSCNGIVVAGYQELRRKIWEPKNSRIDIRSRTLTVLSILAIFRSLAASLSSSFVAALSALSFSFFLSSLGSSWHEMSGYGKSRLRKIVG